VNGLALSETGLLADYLIDHDSDIVDDEVPVGFAVEDKELVLLDKNGRESGLGEIGELAVRSRYLAVSSGLEHNGAVPQQDMLFLTGDLALRRPDGSLVHKGRSDGRLKPRGYTINPALIEAALRAHADINDAAVVLRRESSGGERLIAYLACSHKSFPSPEALRSFLWPNFPDYMIPSVFVRVDEMPIAANGKLDRAALPDPGNGRPELTTAFAAPEGIIEKELARIWSDILCVQPVGVHDNFFALGGHSLSAIRIVSRVLTEFEVEFPADFLFQSPTIAEMAAAIGERRRKTPPGTQLGAMLHQMEELSETEAERQLNGAEPQGKQD
jgi:non-ribosomal peptide synthetase component F